MCADMIDLKKAMTKITELEEELKSTHDGYEEEIATLVEKRDDLEKKLKVFMGFPASRGEDEDLHLSRELHHHRRHRLRPRK